MLASHQVIKQVICVQAPLAIKTMQEIVVRCEHCAPCIPAQIVELRRLSQLMALHTVLELRAIQVTMAHVVQTGRCVTLTHVSLKMCSGQVLMPHSVQVWCAAVLMRPPAVSPGQHVHPETQSSSVQQRITPVPLLDLTGLWFQMHCVLVPHALLPILQLAAEMCARHCLQVAKVLVLM